MKSRLIPILVVLLGVGITCLVNGCGDDDAEGTCESACNRILNCANAFGIDPADFSVQACNADCGSEDPEKISCVDACNASPNCISYAPCVGACGVNFDED